MVKLHKLAQQQGLSQESEEQILESVVRPFNYSIQKDKRFTKEKDGLFHIGDRTYAVLFGTRDEVWNGIAYKTSGELTKLDLTIGKNGKIVSKKKYDLCSIENRLPKANRNKQLISIEKTEILHQPSNILASYLLQHKNEPLREKKETYQRPTLIW